VPPEGHLRGTASGFYIASGREEAWSQDTYRRDAAVLERALETEQDAFLISCYTFYLAQIYQDAGEREKALTNYLKRAELGYWDQEVFVSISPRSTAQGGAWLSRDGYHRVLPQGV